MARDVKLNKLESQKNITKKKISRAEMGLELVPTG